MPGVYEHWYTPNNAVVVVVGDVEPQKVLALARRYYGVLAQKATPHAKRSANRSSGG